MSGQLSVFCGSSCRPAGAGWHARTASPAGAVPVDARRPARPLRRKRARCSPRSRRSREAANRRLWLHDGVSVAARIATPSDPAIRPLPASSGIRPWPVCRHRPDWRQRRGDRLGWHRQAHRDDASRLRRPVSGSRLQQSGAACADPPIACLTLGSSPADPLSTGRPPVDREPRRRPPSTPADGRPGDRPGGRVRAPAPHGNQRHRRGGHLQAAAIALRSGAPGLTTGYGRRQSGTPPGPPPLPSRREHRRTARQRRDQGDRPRRTSPQHARRQVTGTPGGAILHSVARQECGAPPAHAHLRPGPRRASSSTLTQSRARSPVRHSSRGQRQVAVDVILHLRRARPWPRTLASGPSRVSHLPGVLGRPVAGPRP